MQRLRNFRQLVLEKEKRRSENFFVKIESFETILIEATILMNCLLTTIKINESESFFEETETIREKISCIEIRKNC